MEYAIVKVTWFMENFSKREHRRSIQEEGKIDSAAGEGRVPFVASSDIAHLAYALLTCPAGSSLLREESYRALGSELLTHDQAAVTSSGGLGKKVEHVNLRNEEIAKHYASMGITQQRAQVMGMLHKWTNEGEEEKIFEDSVVRRLQGGSR